MERKTARNFGTIRRPVIKIGSQALLTPSGAFDAQAFGAFVAQIAHLRRDGLEPIVVSSGAVALGREALGRDRKPGDLAEKQAFAAIGQGRLMNHYQMAFHWHGLLTAQILLTHHNFASRQQFLNARRTIGKLLELGAIPVVNENDTVATEEIRFGDNDMLSALVVNAAGADLLLILTDVAGLYDRPPTEPGARLLATVAPGQDVAAAVGGKSRAGTGGMASKVQAARNANAIGVPAIVAAAREPSAILRAVRGETIGTLFEAGPARLQSRKGWIRFSQKPKGRIAVDDGAKAALTQANKSLLPKGVTGVEGDFDEGDAVEITAGGQAFAVGLTRFSAADLRQIMGAPTSRIATTLGREGPSEAVHRDDLVLL